PFGAGGAALVHNGSVYFQYRGKPGLWQLLEGQAQPQLLVENLEENMRLLAADEGGVYFVAGGQCRESAISRLDLTTGEHHPFMTRDRQRLKSLSFHPQAGVVQQVCELPDANILMLEQGRDCRGGGRLICAQQPLEGPWVISHSSDR